MRRAKKEIQTRAIVDNLLNTCPVGRLGTIGNDGYPRIKPLNFVYLNGKIYFHSAKEGEKIDDIIRDNRVIFEIDEPMGYVKSGINPCSAKYLYRSLMIRGRAAIVDNEGKASGLKIADGKISARKRLWRISTRKAQNHGCSTY